MTIPDLITCIVRRRLPFGQEATFQDALETLLMQEGCPFTREYDLQSNRGRVDFYLPTLRTGLELKVKGAPGEVLRQLARYMSSPEIDALVLVTGRVRLGAVPSTLGGKPLHVAAVWRGGL